ncbi:hypothetical protein GCM10011583_03440 [Streptomyces camponoticapitis]|uniref:Uncharacterized protein n=1 Tax=Streptomyces camponoticapitis TaxID=1616125 RepID=A0ABQ2E0T7_9ACTN|nr:hypothetical protein GCM10011583_03440 [Streptomyces camponoticapitis]
MIDRDFFPETFREPLDLDHADNLWVRKAPRHSTGGGLARSLLTERSRLPAVHRPSTTTRTAPVTELGDRPQAVTATP